MNTSKKEQQNLLLPPELVRDFRKAAYNDRVSQSAMGEEAIRKFLTARATRLERKAEREASKVATTAMGSA